MRKNWRIKWQPNPVFLPGESRGQGSLVGCRTWGHKESYTTEWPTHERKNSICSYFFGYANPWDAEKGQHHENVTAFLLLLSFSRSVISDSLWLHGLQHARPTCHTPSPTVHLSSCPLNWWCHPTVSSSVSLFSFYLQSFPASGSFPMSRRFTSVFFFFFGTSRKSSYPKCFMCLPR